MVYPSDSKASGGSSRPASSRSALLIGVAVALLVVLAVGIAALLDVLPFGISRRDAAMAGLWNRRDYVQVIARAESQLAERPLDPQALTFGGFAYFYRGVDAADTESQRLDLDRSIRFLRKALHLPDAPLAAERSYVLAKAYHHRGGPYHDLVVTYMEDAIAAGLRARDSLVYLALGLADGGEFLASAEAFVEAAAFVSQQADSPASDAPVPAGSEVGVLRIRAAESYAAARRHSEAEEQLRMALGGLEDRYLWLLARNRLAGVLIASGQYSTAEEFVLETIELHPESADAYYYLGVVYDRTARQVEARTMWRTARQIDPDHTEALMSLATGGR